MTAPFNLATRFLASLRSWPWLGTFITLATRFREDRLALTAGSLTFTSIISLVPLATVTLAIFSAFPMFAALQDALQRSLVASLVPETISRQVLGWVTQFSTRANRLGIAGLIALIVTSLALMLTIDRALNSIWRVRRPRSIGKRVIVYWSALTLGPLFVAVSLAATSFAVSASAGYFGPFPKGLSFLVGSIDFAFLVIGMAALFHYVPNTRVRWQHAFLGGLFVAVFFSLAKRLLVYWFGVMPTYSAVYGAFASLPIFLVWMFLGWCIVLLGAVIAAYAPVARMKVSRWPAVAGSRFHHAVAILRLLERAREQGARGLTAHALATTLAVDPLQTDEILDALLQLDLVGRLDESGPRRHVLLRDLAATPAEPLLAKLLLDPSPDSGAFWRAAQFDKLTLADAVRESS